MFNNNLHMDSHVLHHFWKSFLGNVLSLLADFVLQLIKCSRPRVPIHSILQVTPQEEIWG
jgi:hypothetical protein